MIKLIQHYPYDNRYDYIKTFTSKTEQKSYFNTFNYTIFTDDNYIKDHFNSFKVPLNYDYMVDKGMNYVIFNNGHKDIYAFIIQKEYISEEVTRIIFEIDVFQTYMFDFIIKNSYVERMNCPISEVSDYDEGFNIGEHEQVEIVTHLPKYYEYYAMFNGFKNQELIFTDGKLSNVIEAPFATNRPVTVIDGIQYPLHFMPLKETYEEPKFTLIDIENGSSATTGDWQNGILSSEGFRFIKGMEGFAPRPYQDPGGYWTIAYGVSQVGEPTIYQELVNRAPLMESDGAQVSYELKNKNYGKPIVEACKKLGVTKQNQFDALCSLAYNSGVGSVTGDNTLTRAIMKDITDETTIRAVWENFKITSNGIELSGLKALRKEQCNMFFGKKYEVRQIPLINENGLISGVVKDNNGDGWLP